MGQAWGCACLHRRAGQPAWPRRCLPARLRVVARRPQVRRSDVQSAWSGIRPLALDPNASGGGWADCGVGLAWPGAPGAARAVGCVRSRLAQHPASCRPPTGAPQRLMPAPPPPLLAAPPDVLLRLLTVMLRPLCPCVCTHVCVCVRRRHGQRLTGPHRHSGPGRPHHGDGRQVDHVPPDGTGRGGPCGTAGAAPRRPLRHRAPQAHRLRCERGRPLRAGGRGGVLGQGREGWVSPVAGQGREGWVLPVAGWAGVQEREAEEGRRAGR